MMAGLLLDISKHENILRAAQPALSGRKARLYQFPSRTPLTKAEMKLEKAVALPARSRVRLHLLAEIAIGVAIWLIWYIWHLLH